MIDPLQSATRILRNNPDLAEDLFDLFVCAREGRGAIIEADLDETEDYIYSQTPDSQKGKGKYKRERLHPRSQSQTTTKAELLV